MILNNTEAIRSYTLVLLKLQQITDIFTLDHSYQNYLNSTYLILLP